MNSRSIISGLSIIFSLASVVYAGDTREAYFNDGWKFFLGDDSAASAVKFDDAKWRTVQLPHDWSIEGQFDSKLAACTAFLPCGTAWYRKTFSIPADAAGKSVRIRFDGVMNHSTVYLNGKEVGGRPYGYTSFTCNLSDAMNPGGDNVLAARVDHEQYADSRWYAGSGIYRNVLLEITDNVHVDTDGVYVTTPNVSADSATVNLVTSIANDGKISADISIVQTIKDSSGATVATANSSASVAGESKKDISTTATVSHPMLWSVDSPNMYLVLTQVKRGNEIADEFISPIGIRSFKFDADKGFSLNGQTMKLKGVCLHIDGGALGDAVPAPVWEYRLKLLKEAGCNAIRTSHNPPDPAFLDLCDRLGFVVMDEAFDEWTGGKKKWVVGHDVGTPGHDGYHSDFNKWADADIHDMIVRDRNHPSIILWSIGNEIDYNNDPFPPGSDALPPIAARLIKDVKAVDVTRPVTAACAFPATNLFKMQLDVEGYNYMEKLYAADHAANPSRIIFGSENNHSYSAWQSVTQNDFIAGQFLWTGVDYLGEAAPWPAHASPDGLLNLAGFPKNMYYFRKSLWTDKPMVYLSTTSIPSARGNRAASGSQIFCFTNCESVELFQDGKSLGSKPEAGGQILNWPVEFTSGEIKAVGTKGPETTEFVLKKAGKPAKLVIHPTPVGTETDGRSIGMIEVDVMDADGVIVPDANARITCAIEGAGRILGIENGDIRSTENYQDSRHSVYQGRMMVYVEWKSKTNAPKVLFSSPGLESTSANVVAPN